jgi:hypothetical protein
VKQIEYLFLFLDLREGLWHEKYLGFLEERVVTVQQYSAITSLDNIPSYAPKLYKCLFGYNDSILLSTELKHNSFLFV